jgi:hypothetical protein
MSWEEKFTAGNDKLLLRSSVSPRLIALIYPAIDILSQCINRSEDFDSHTELVECIDKRVSILTPASTGST